MKTLLLSAVLSLSFVAASASAALTTEETSAWKRIRFIESTDTTEKSTTSAWKRIRFAKVDVTKDEAPKKAWKRIRF